MRRTAVSVLAGMLSLPQLEGLDAGSVELLAAQRGILLRRRMALKVFGHFFRKAFLLEKKLLRSDGLRVELGSGTALVKQIDSSVITSDIRSGKGIDRVIDACDTHLDDRSVSLLMAFNMFHHLPDPEAFFAETDRILVPGGGLILLEPWYGPLAALVYRNLFRTEGFDRSQEGWDQGNGELAGNANQALSYVVFRRDRKEFDERWPSLQVVHEEVMDNFLGYIASGGVNFRQLLPSWSYALIRFAEWLLRPARRILGLHHIIVIRKQQAGFNAPN